MEVIPPDLFGSKNPNYKAVGQAMHEAGMKVMEALNAALSGTVFPGMTGSVNKPEWQSHLTYNEIGLFYFEVVVTAPSELDTLEKGKPAYDMKPGLLAGPRHRVGENGPYNIVPFRHQAAQLPEAVAQLASQLTLSRIVGTYVEIRSDDGARVIRNRYAWGSNTGSVEEHSPPKVSWTGYRHKASVHSNLYKFPGESLVTFRTVSAKSDPLSWWHPAKAANPVTESVWSFMQPMVEAHIAAAWERVMPS